MATTISGTCTKQELNRIRLAMENTDGRFKHVWFCISSYHYCIVFNTGYSEYQKNWERLTPIVEKTSSRWIKIKRKIIGRLKALA